MGPKELGALVLLRYLYLSQNFIWGEIPNTFGMLTQLRVLSMSDNFLSGTIPQMSLLTSLQILDLSKNNFSGTVTDSLAFLPNLVIINLSENPSIEGAGAQFCDNQSYIIYIDTFAKEECWCCIDKLGENKLSSSQSEPS